MAPARGDPSGASISSGVRLRHRRFVLSGEKRASREKYGVLRALRGRFEHPSYVVKNV
jgi:hypothetical protein